MLNANDLNRLNAFDGVSMEADEVSVESFDEELALA